MPKQLSERKAWEYLENAFLNADECGNVSMGVCSEDCLCGAIWVMRIYLRLITEKTRAEMLERIRTLARTMDAQPGEYLFQTGTKKCATLRAAYCRKQVKLLTPKAKTATKPAKQTTKPKPKTVKTK